MGWTGKIKEVATERRLSLLATLALVVVTFLQLRLVFEDFVQPRLERYWQLRSLAAWERSALLSEGEDFLEFVAFLKENIPDTGKVVLPPHASIGEAGPFTNISFVQYFMFPRQVLNCAEPVDECVLALSGARSYLVRIGSFPPPEAASVHKRYVHFKDELGVFAPR